MTVVGLAGVIPLASLAPVYLPLGALYVLKGTGAFTVIMLVAVGFLRKNHPFTRFGPANQITTARAALVALVVGLLGEPRIPASAAAAVAVAIVAAMLDGADGWLARRSGMASEFGARFDMEVDALLVLVLATLAWQFEKAGVWVLLSGALRYLFVVAGWRRPWVHRPLPRSVRRQAICVVQTVGLILTLAPVVAAPLSSVLAAMALCALAWSFLVDIVWLWRQAPPRMVGPATRTTADGRVFPSSF